MNMDKIKNLHEGLNTAFLDQTFQSNQAYRPQFIYNDNKKGQKVFSSIEEELLRCRQLCHQRGLHHAGRHHIVIADIKGAGAETYPWSDFNYRLFMLQRSGRIEYVSKPF